MSKSFVLAMIATQYEVLLATSNKDRLKYVVSCVEDGTMYNLKDDELGKWDGEDAEFFTKEDLDLARITTSKLKNAQLKMLDYFGIDKDVEEEDVEEKDVEEKDVEEEEAPTDGLPEVDIDEVIAKCKKAIKKGNAKKAKKLLGFIPENVKAFKKLSKKIKEL